MMRRLVTKQLVLLVAAAVVVGSAAVGSLAFAHNDTPSGLSARGASAMASATSTTRTSSSTSTSTSTSATTGNGAPSGPHFNLNIHGVANGQGFNGNNQNDIFVPLGSTGSPAGCKILLQQATTYDFQVLQPDCVNNPPASFELPAPCAITAGACSGTTTIYSVYARALGKPGGQSSTTLCFTDTTGTFCSLTSYVAVRGTGNSKFTNETSNLLFITLCSTTTNKTVVTPLFGNSLAQYFWQYDNQGLRLLQLRFYQVGSAVPTGGNPCA